MYQSQKMQFFYQNTDRMANATKIK